MKAHPPVIVIGMHRSGTSMLTRMLETLGLFVGWRKTGTHEALFFQRLNKWLLRQSGGSMENPASINYLLEDQQTRALVVRLIHCTLNTPWAVSFLGWTRYLRYHTPANLDVPWGWKDPRNTYTLPIWLDVFPEAKVVHLYRHGVDVAASLKARRERILSRIEKRYAKFGVFYWFYLMLKLIPKRRGFVDLRGASLKGGFSMWEEYVEKARTYVHDLRDQAIEVKYEDFLVRPEEVLEELAGFCELTCTAAEIAKATGQVRKDRAYAYRGNSELEAFAAQVAGRLRRQGY
ncbi:MAG: sulfotransferase [Candidatus Bathyarchaeia archaeon]